MAKKLNKIQIEQFRIDIRRLKEVYSNEELARMLDVDPGNLSSYASGSKNPGPGFIKKFYEVLGDELAKLGPGSNFSQDDASTSFVNEADAEYKRKYEDELIRELKENNRHWRSAFTKIVETNQTLAESNKDMSKSTLILTQTNEKLVDKLNS